MQIQPRPLTMSSVKLPSSERVRNDPPSAISTPPTTSAVHRVRATEMPAVSAASGFSPTAVSRRPAPVDRSTHHTAGASTRKATNVIGYWARMPAAGEQPVELRGDGPLAAAEQQPVGEVAGGDQQQGGADAGDVLVHPQRHRQQRHQRSGERTGDDGRERSHGQRAGARGDQEADEGTGVHRALDAEVEDAGPLAQQRAERAEHQRGGDGQGRGEHRDDREVHGSAPSRSE